MFNWAKASLESLHEKDQIKHDLVWQCDYQGSDSYMFAVHLFKHVPYGLCTLPLKNPDNAYLVPTQFLSTLTVGFL